MPSPNPPNSTQDPHIASDSRRKAGEKVEDTRLICAATGARLIGDDGRATQAARGKDGKITRAGRAAIGIHNLQGAKGGLRKGDKKRPVFVRIKESLLRELEKCLKDPAWFKNLSEHSQTQLFKMVLPSTPPDRTVDKAPSADVTLRVQFDDHIRLKYDPKLGKGQARTLEQAPEPPKPMVVQPEPLGAEERAALLEANRERTEAARTALAAKRERDREAASNAARIGIVTSTAARAYDDESHWRRLG